VLRNMAEREKTVLVVEDEAELRELLCGRLRNHGYRALEAGGGREATELIERESLDLVIMDLMLPEIDGWRLCQKLKTEPNYQNVRIIVLSGLVEQEGGGGQLEQCDFLISKPFDLKVLLEKVEELIGPA
jgi:CheY-like chemotaxis protein